MPKTIPVIFQGLPRFAGGIVSVMLASKAAAQAPIHVPPINTGPAQCMFDISYAAAPVPPVAVPSMSMLGVALLVFFIGFLAWRNGHFPGARFMAVVLVAAAAVLANQGGGGLVQQAYAAVRNINLTDPAGGTINVGTGTPPSVFSGDELTLTNTTAKPLVISSVNESSVRPGANVPDLGNCSPGTKLAPGASCTGTVSSTCNVCSRPAVSSGGNCLMCPVGTVFSQATNECRCVNVPGAPVPAYCRP